MSYIQAIFTREGDWGVKGSENLAECYDGGGGRRNPHESIIDHGSRVIRLHPPDLCPKKRVGICYKHYSGKKIQGA